MAGGVGGDERVGDAVGTVDDGEGGFSADGGGGDRS